MDEKKPDYHFNLILLGAGGAGKSSLVRNWMGEPFDEALGPSFAYEQVDQTIKIGEKRIRLHVNVAAGQKVFDQLIRTYVKKIHGIFFIFSSQKPQTLEDVFSHYLPISDQHAELKFVKMLVATKTDLATPNFTRAEELAEQHDMLFVQTSAKFGQNVDLVFEAMANQILESFLNAEAEHQTPQAMKRDKTAEMQLKLLQQMTNELREMKLQQSEQEERHRNEIKKLANDKSSCVLQ